MSTETKTGGPAFPVMPPVDETGRCAVGYPYPAEGATVRDYFAAKVLAALISEPPFDAGSQSAVIAFSDGFKGDPLNRYAYVAYRFADAMLKARAQ